MTTRIGPYSIIRQIGGGGQGQVFLGHDRRLQRRVAIKIHRLPDSRRARRDTLREARRLAGIRDPRVVQIHDVVESSDHLALVMEYVPGCNLEDLLRHTRPSLASILRIATDLSAALAAARRQQLVHGDLKASNVLVSTEGRVLLTDFGIARSTREHPAPAPAGSLEALAPEQLRGAPLDVRTDLFALGRLLYRLLTGEHAFTRAGLPSAAALQEGGAVAVRDHLPANHALPDALCDLVDHLLCRDPEQRPVDTHPVRRVLRELARAQAADAGPGLLAQAAPLFRAESPGELPPAVPMELSRRGRSRSAQLALRRRLLALWPDPAPARAALLSLSAIVVVLALAYWRESPRDVLVEAPRLELGSGAVLGQGIDIAFLAQVLESGLREQRGATLLEGLLPPRVLRLGVAGEQRRAAAEVLTVNVRCGELFCLLDLSRRADDDTRHDQRILASNARPDQWQRSIDAALVSLFP